MAVIQNYNSKNTHRALLYAVKIAEAVFQCAFTMVFPTSPCMGARQCYSLLPPPTLMLLRKEEVIPRFNKLLEVFCQLLCNGVLII